MTGILEKCPYCGNEQFIPIQIISKNDLITIEKPYTVCEFCVE